MVHRAWATAAFNAAYAALPLMLGVAIVTALDYVDHPSNTSLSVVRLGLNQLAAFRFWTVTAMSAGPILLLGAAGMVAARRQRLGDAWPFVATMVAGAWCYFYVDIRDHQDVYVGWRVGHLFFMALSPFVGLAALAIVRQPSPWRRGLAAAAAALVVVVALPTVAIDFYNTQDIVQREMGPGFRWVQILSPDEWAGLAWIREHTPPDAVVQVDAYARDSDTWAYIPAFAERRMGVGLPLSMVPLLKYQEGSHAVQWMYDIASPGAAHEMAARVGIDYIVVGEPERRAHPGVDVRFHQVPDLLPEVFHNQALTVYAVRGARAASATSGRTPSGASPAGAPGPRQRVERADEQRVEGASLPAPVQPRLDRESLGDDLARDANGASSAVNSAIGVLAQHRRVLVLERHLHHLRQRVQPRDPVVDHEDGLAARLQHPVASATIRRGSAVYCSTPWP